MVRSGDTTAVYRLLARRLDGNLTQPDGATALHWAAERDNLEVADALLMAGTRANVGNDYGVTPRVLAATNGSAPMIERLVAGGTNPNAA